MEYASRHFIIIGRVVKWQTRKVYPALNSDRKGNCEFDKERRTGGEMADTQGLGPCAARREGSTPSLSIVVYAPTMCAFRMMSELSDGV